MIQHWVKLNFLHIGIGPKNNVAIKWLWRDAQSSLLHDCQHCLQQICQEPCKSTTVPTHLLTFTRHNLQNESQPAKLQMRGRGCLRSMASSVIAFHVLLLCSSPPFRHRRRCRCVKVPADTSGRVNPPCNIARRSNTPVRCFHTL